MPSQQSSESASGAPVPASDESTAKQVAENMAKAFEDIAKGEQTATAMENKLSSLEERIDSLLEHFESRPSSGNARGKSE